MGKTLKMRLKIFTNKLIIVDEKNVFVNITTDLF